MGQARPCLIVYGAGGHGLVVADAARAAGWQVCGFWDDDPTAVVPGGWEKVDRSRLKRGGEAVIIAVGENSIRRRIGNALSGLGVESASVVHPSAWVSPLARSGAGVFVGAGAVVQAESSIGEGAIVNSGAVVEHHCRIGAWAHVGPGAVLGGRVVLGEESLVGVGAAVRPGVRIGHRVTVGAGAVVVKDVVDGAVVAGVPARARGG